MKLLFLALPCFLIFSCSSDAIVVDSEGQSIYNPPAEGFDLEGSDPLAIAIADSVMVAHGGRKAWDRARYFSFNFVGARHLVWDRYLGRVRITSNNDSTIYVYDDRTGEGAAKVEGKVITDSTALAEAMERAKGIMINDTYWLVFPYKLKDSGTTLTYVGEVDSDPLKESPSYVIDLTFEQVGNTPFNRYRIFVDRESHLINTWQFYRNAEDEEVSYETPFNNYREVSGLLISDDRGERIKLLDVEILEEVDEAVFSL
ncbi:MAG: hypothetical protein AAF741_05960 [Bacteroidota bacterium]